MSTVPPPRPSSTPDASPLNPAMKQVHDATYGADHQGTDPMESVSLKKDEGAYWPVIWAAATIVCVIVAIVLIVF
ncbi:MAG: hypothetical protein WBA88_21230 [Pseudaminobacter sp.]|uniref:hypothetical protein n=1 Tax=Chelativorans sp. Marseille-P2723 TaxID=2709133 RepID=UPI00157123AE|nr:hypothetical protein [Chelativorans sp. Marseille-P2723]MBN9037611.1 hypothetical protein [Hyphomicrobiales bacterium]